LVNKAEKLIDVSRFTIEIEYFLPRLSVAEEEGIPARLSEQALKDLGVALSWVRREAWMLLTASEDWLENSQCH
jgi:hypothetical protein